MARMRVPGSSPAPHGGTAARHRHQSAACPRVGAGRSVRVRVRPGSDLADQRSPLPGRELVPGRLGDRPPPVQRDLLLLIVVHAG